MWPELKLEFRNGDAILNLNGALKGLLKNCSDVSSIP
jgi:hypothetical protein